MTKQTAQPQNFDEWSQNPYTLVLLKSIDEDYVPRFPQPAHTKETRMTKEQLIEALKMLGRGRIDAAEALAEYMMPTPKTFAVEVPSAPKKGK